MKCYRCNEWPCKCDDGITLIHGDCRDMLPLLPKVDLVLTDPPYGIRADQRQQKRANKQGGAALAPSKDYGDSDWDHSPLSLGDCSRLINYSKVIIWGGQYHPLPCSGCWFVWDKVTGDNTYADCELAWTNLPGTTRMFRWQWKGMIQQRRGVDKEPRWHPTQKPVDLMQWCIQKAGEPRTILDPFAGSGTTLRAAKDLGRKAIGIEIEEKYCKIAAERLRQEVLF